MKKALHWFCKQWSEKPLFSTTLTLAAMIILQTCALGTGYANFGEWGNAFVVNWINVLRNNATVGIIALGMTYVIVSGGIDLAVGSTLTMLGAFFLLLIDDKGILASCHLSGWTAFAVAFALVTLGGAILGEINGIFIAHGGIPAFIVTLGTMKIFRSVTQFFMQKRSLAVPDELLNFSSLQFGKFMLMPILYWLLAAVLLHLLYRKTIFGNHVVAIGSNGKAAKLAGIRVQAVTRRIYVLMGILVGFASIVQVCRIGSMDYANAGSGYEMDAIAAVIVGGTRMSGGRGSIVGTMLGILIIGVMNNLLNLWGVPPFLREAFKGVIVIVAVLFQKKEATA
ncbi:MAG: ABC transporter permease [Lentisphaeria bacterium]|nr:ABC transporter permease [Lentisphaeria bacterium]